MRRAMLVMVVTLLATGAVSANDRLPPVTSTAVNNACGECHMAYQPQLLPRASWHMLIDRLNDHFGETASLEAPLRQEVLTYLLDHAADADRTKGARKFLQGIDVQNPPLRITEAPWFVREHRQVAAKTWQKAIVKSKANCQACHPQAGQGNYEAVRLP